MSNVDQNYLSSIPIAPTTDNNDDVKGKMESDITGGFSLATFNSMAYPEIHTAAEANVAVLPVGNDYIDNNNNSNTDMLANNYMPPEYKPVIPAAELGASNAIKETKVTKKQRKMKYNRDNARIMEKLKLLENLKRFRKITIVFFALAALSSVLSIISTAITNSYLDFIGIVAVFLNFLANIFSLKLIVVMNSITMKVFENHLEITDDESISLYDGSNMGIGFSFALAAMSLIVASVNGARNSGKLGTICDLSMMPNCNFETYKGRYNFSLFIFMIFIYVFEGAYFAVMRNRAIRLITGNRMKNVLQPTCTFCCAAGLFSAGFTISMIFAFAQILISAVHEKTSINEEARHENRGLETEVNLLGCDVTRIIFFILEFAFGSYQLYIRKCILIGARDNLNCNIEACEKAFFIFSLFASALSMSNLVTSGFIAPTYNISIVKNLTLLGIETGLITVLTLGYFVELVANFNDIVPSRLLGLAGTTTTTMLMTFISMLLNMAILKYTISRGSVIVGLILALLNVIAASITLEVCIKSKNNESLEEKTKTTGGMSVVSVVFLLLSGILWFVIGSKINTPHEKVLEQKDDLILYNILSVVIGALDLIAFCISVAIAAIIYKGPQTKWTYKPQLSSNI